MLWLHVCGPYFSRTDLSDLSYDVGKDLVTAFLTFPSVIVGVLMFTMLSTYRFLHHDN